MLESRKLLMTQEEIAAYNKWILSYEEAKVVDLSKIPAHIEAEKVISLIMQYDFGNHGYLNGRLLTDDEKKSIENNRNLLELETPLRCHDTDRKVHVKYGIVIHQANVRSFPTNAVLMDSPTDWALDYFQETKLSAEEGVCIYHCSKEKDWLFVQALNYAGWIQRHCIQFCTREEMLQRIDSRKREYLPYTTANVIKLAFDLIGTTYSWGNKGDGLDCSGVVLSVYEQFGFTLPRNTSSMAACKDLLMNVNGMTANEKKELLKAGVLPGSLLLMNGHVLMYLGIHNGIVYALHGFTKYYDDLGNRKDVMACAVTSMDIKRKDGTTFLDGVHSVWQIIPEGR